MDEATAAMVFMSAAIMSAFIGFFGYGGILPAAAFAALSVPVVGVVMMAAEVSFALLGFVKRLFDG